MNELAVRAEPIETPEQPKPLTALSLEDVGRVAQHFAQSGYFKDATSRSQAIVKILAGQELGVGPFQSMKAIFIVNGKPEYEAALMAALIKRSGKYDYKIRKLESDECIIDFFEYQGGSKVHLGESSFSMKDADIAELRRNDTYRKFPRNMLFARALSNGANWHCSDVFMGSAYTPGEIDTAGPGGERIVESIPVTHLQEAVVNNNPAVAEADVADDLVEEYAETLLEYAQAQVNKKTGEVEKLVKPGEIHRVVPKEEYCPECEAANGAHFSTCSFNPL